MLAVTKGFAPLSSGQESLKRGRASRPVRWSMRASEGHAADIAAEPAAIDERGR
jgi:hypothetical protein